jgi:uncharacterized membrane protein
MPFCSQCGNQVMPVDVYCARCGGRQPMAASPSPARHDPLAGITPRTASILCYVPGVGWIAAIVVLAAEKFRGSRTVRFHAFQGLYLFVAWLMNDIVVKPMFYGMAPSLHFNHIISAILLVASIFMMVKASQDEEFSLPLFGELAHRSMTDNR